MMFIKLSIAVSRSLILLASCSNAQTQSEPKLIGGPCEGCEAVLEYKDQSLNAVDTLPGFYEKGTRIKVSGTIYNSDGKTPAENVILYAYHTNRQGVYAPKKNATGWAEKHGYMRGSVKTDEDGKYTFYTLKPAPYPGRTEPAHIHFTILEPNGKYYWLGSCVFERDSLLTEKEINPVLPRGGSSGLLSLKKEGYLLEGKRDIILGKNVPGYE